MRMALLTAALCLMLSACEIPESKGGEGFAFEYDSVRYEIGADVSGVLTELSECNYTEQSAGCGVDESVGVYYHEAFRLEVRQWQGRKIIWRITLNSPLAQTSEGISLGDKDADVIRVYGDSCDKRGRCIIYKKEGTELCFGIRDGRVVSIAYEYIANSR